MNYDQDIIDYIREHGATSPGRLMFFMSNAGTLHWNSIEEIDFVLKRLVLEKRLIASTNGIMFRLPYGHHQSDYEFTIKEIKIPCGKFVWGVVWEAGGESWSWDIYGMALDHAREKVRDLTCAITHTKQQ